MLALTYISKAQYRDIKKTAMTNDIAGWLETYGVGFPLKAQQYAIVEILESCWEAYKASTRHAPKDSDEFFEFITEKTVRINGTKPNTCWNHCIGEYNARATNFNRMAKKDVVPYLRDNMYTRALLYTHIKAKIGDWEDDE